VHAVHVPLILPCQVRLRKLREHNVPAIQCIPDCYAKHKHLGFPGPGGETSGHGVHLLHGKVQRQPQCGRVSTGFDHWQRDHLRRYQQLLLPTLHGAGGSLRAICDRLSGVRDERMQCAVEPTATVAATAIATTAIAAIDQRRCQAAWGSPRGLQPGSAYFHLVSAMRAKC
jgi:hypothetical protein